MKRRARRGYTRKPKDLLAFERADARARVASLEAWDATEAGSPSATRYHALARDANLRAADAADALGARGTIVASIRRETAARHAELAT